jgi:hypothetical protein
MKAKVWLLLIGLGGLAGAYFYNQKGVVPVVAPNQSVPVKCETFTGNPEDLLTIQILHGNTDWSVRKVLQEAQLEQRLPKLKASEIGQADGQALLGSYVMLKNASEVADFLQQAGYKAWSGPTQVRRYQGRLLEVEVEITNQRQQHLQVILSADGSKQGEG